VTGGVPALALPLTQKLAEKGILLSYHTERELDAMRKACATDGTPLRDDFCEAVRASLYAYRVQVGLLSERVGVLGWHPDFSDFGPLPESTWPRFDAITRDWQEFMQYSKFLRGFLARHIDLKTEKLEHDGGAA
jgi:hypothetical protein